MDAVVLYPAPGISHLISMVELGKLMLKHNPSLSIIILISTPGPFFAGAGTDPYIRRVSATTPSVAFHHLPALSTPLDPLSCPSFIALLIEFLRLNCPNVHRALQSISQSHTICAFIIDFFCTPSLSAPTAADLNIPVYYFITSAASCLALIFYLPTIHRTTTANIKDLPSPLHFPGLPPIPTSDMPEPVLERSSPEYAALMDYASRLPESSGLLVNTFESLESKPLKAMSDGICVPDAPTPPVLAVGPLVAANDRAGGGRGEGVPDCLTWLDSQPSRSVVFLCFGSRGFGVFSKEQLKEIAIGLERSGQRFLWVVLSPPTADNSSGSGNLSAPPDPDLDSLLPDGFLDRTGERGLVVKQWVPQVAVLSHESVGGFVTHCGWNSVLEAVCAGVPMVAWPLYAEQRFNKVVLVEEMKVAVAVAVAMEESPADGFVSAAEVEKSVTRLMVSEVGKSVRETVWAMKEEAAAAMRDGGSSYVALANLIHSWTHK